MKTRALMMFALSILLFQAFAQREPNRYSLEKAFNITMPLSSASRQVLKLKFDGKNPKLEIKLGNKKQFLEFDSLMLEADLHGSLLVDDFNFDGSTDLGIPTGIGYGGVNYFYDFYIFDRSSQTFKYMPSPEPELCGWSNPQLEQKSKTIFTSCKSGPQWFSQNFRFYRSKPYVYQSGEMVILEGFPDNDLLWRETTFKPDQQVIGSKIFNYGTTKIPVLRIPQSKVFLYNVPQDTAITTNYIVKNDLITILEVKDTDSGQWLKIAYYSRRLGWIKRWIRLEN
jgi:GW (Gly-Tryp) dipeptide domain